MSEFPGVRITWGIRQYGELACNSLPGNTMRGISRNSCTAVAANQARDEERIPRMRRNPASIIRISTHARCVAIVRTNNWSCPIFSPGRLARPLGGAAFSCICSVASLEEL